jgi:large repetitive protein
MAYVDVDSDATTFNSSRANLALPAGARVLFAGLYWGSVTTTPTQAAARTQVRFSTPGTTGYAAVNGTLVGSITGAADFSGTPTGDIYQGFADVTTQVRTAGNGTYTVANVQGTTELGAHAGWSLVVAYRLPGGQARSLTVFDGFALQASTDLPLNVPISGFVASRPAR